MRYFVVFCISVVWFLVGMVDTNSYTLEKRVSVVKTGDTLDAIAGRYYNENENKMTWQEFRYKVMSDNEKLGKYIKAGDVVVIEVAKKVH